MYCGFLFSTNAMRPSIRSFVGITWGEQDILESMVVGLVDKV